jgi:hypothetical protein
VVSAGVELGAVEQPPDVGDADDVAVRGVVIAGSLVQHGLVPEPW